MSELSVFIFVIHSIGQQIPNSHLMISASETSCLEKQPEKNGQKMLSSGYLKKTLLSEKQHPHS